MELTKDKLDEIERNIRNKINHEVDGLSIKELQELYPRIFAKMAASLDDTALAKKKNNEPGCG